jgi:hypothetical protein
MSVLLSDALAPLQAGVVELVSAISSLLCTCTYSSTACSRALRVLSFSAQVLHILLASYLSNCSSAQLYDQ